MKFSIVLANTTRSKEYTKQLLINKLVPKKIIYYCKNKNIKFFNMLKKFKTKIVFYSTNNINNKNITDEINNSNSRYIVYSGYPGEIIASDILQNKKIIHCHPGMLPNYGGSTVLYYSLLTQKKIFCTCLILNKKIDDGKILYIEKFKKPKKIKSIEKEYDDKIRAKTLISFLKGRNSLLINKRVKKKLNYYIAHPIIRQLVINPSIFSFLKDK